MPGKISVHRLLGYHVSLITQGYMSFLMDAILFVFLLLVVKPAMLVLIYGELFLMLIWFIASTILIELYEIIPLILLCTYLFYPNSLMTCRLSGLVVLEKLLLMGPSRYHNFQGVLEYFQHVVSPSLMTATPSHTEPWRTQAAPTVTAASTPMASWHTCGMKLRVHKLPPVRGAAISVILG